MTTFRTGNPVPSTAVRDLYDNAENFDTALNGQALTWVDRLDKTRKSFSGFEKDAADFVAAAEAAIDRITSFNYRGQWQASTQYFPKDVVRYDGIEYITMQDHVSGASFEADEAAGLWTIYQGIARAELSAPAGSDLVGFSNVGPNAVSRTVQEKLRESSISVMDYWPEGETDASIAINLADAVAKSLNKNLLLPEGDLTLKNPVYMTTNWIGAGVGVWDLPSHGRTFTQQGTQLRFLDGPTQFETVQAVTDMALSGGVVANPDATGTADAFYRLNNYMNADRSGVTAATPLSLKVGVVVKGSNLTLSGVRIVPDFNGIVGYNNTTTPGLGANLDVGLLVNNCSFFSAHNVQVVGYWRKSAMLQVNSQLGYGVPNAGAIFNSYERCYFQGFKGVSIRGNDVARCTGLTASSVEIPFNASNPLPAAGTIYLNGNEATYTSISQSSDKLTISGLSINPTTVLAVGGEVQFGNNIGVASCSFNDCVVTDLQHSSRVLSTGLGFSYPSEAFEISGYPLRDVEFNNVHVFAQDVMFHIHDAQHVSFVGCFFEPTGWKSTVGGAFGSPSARAIVSPLASSSNAFGPYPAGHTDSVTFDASSEWNSAGDFRPVAAGSSAARFPVGGLFFCESFDWQMQGPGVAGRRFAPMGYNKANQIMLAGPRNTGNFKKLEVVDDDFNRYFQIWDDGTVSIGKVVGATKPGQRITMDMGSGFGALNLTTTSTTTDTAIQHTAPTKTWQLRPRQTGGRYAVIFNGVDKLSIGEDGGLFPPSDATQSLGYSANRWDLGFIRELRIGNGAVKILNGSGSPEGVVTAAIGSIYTRSDGAAGTTLYVKEVGFGNTGWTAK